MSWMESLSFTRVHVQRLVVQIYLLQWSHLHREITRPKQVYNYQMGPQLVPRLYYRGTCTLVNEGLPIHGIG